MYEDEYLRDKDSDLNVNNIVLWYIMVFFFDFLCIVDYDIIIIKMFLVVV